MTDCCVAICVVPVCKNKHDGAKEQGTIDKVIIEIFLKDLYAQEGR